MNDIYDSCHPIRPAMRSSQTRVNLITTQPSLDAKVVIMGSAGTYPEIAASERAALTCWLQVWVKLRWSLAMSRGALLHKP